MRLTQRIASNTKRIGLGAMAFMALLSFAVIPETASAHYVYRSGTLYYSGADCVDGYSEISHGSGSGYSSSRLDSKNNSGPSGNNCSGNFYRPAGYLRIRQMRMYYSSGWRTCNDTGNLYNTYNTAWFNVNRTYGGTCGARTYETQSFIHELNGSWNGGVLWSGGHWLPV